MNELTPYFPADHQDIEHSGIEVHYFGYYLESVPAGGLLLRGRSLQLIGQPGPYRRHLQRIRQPRRQDRRPALLHHLHQFGLGRASYDASQEIGDSHLTHEEGMGLVRRFDGEFPARYSKRSWLISRWRRNSFIGYARFHSPHSGRRKQRLAVDQPVWAEEAELLGAGKVLIAPDRTISEAIRLIDGNSAGIALVVEAERRLIGTVTDGDVAAPCCATSRSTPRFRPCSNGRPKRRTGRRLPRPSAPRPPSCSC